MTGLAAVAAVAVAAPGHGDAARPDSLLGPGDAVPFIAQGPLLCGGAAIAMVERYWGARGVYAEDFVDLVRPDEGGIRASDLARAAAERGYDAQVVSGELGTAAAALARGRPPILLLDAGAAELHYVVLVALGPREARIHDPGVGPSRRVDQSELLARWRASGHWMLLVGPSAVDPPARGQVRDARTGGMASDGAARGPPPIPGDAGGRAPDTARLARARAHLASGDFAAARDVARALSEGGPADRRASSRIHATALWLEGDPDGALAFWNALGEPAIDLVSMRGLRRTRWSVAAGALDLAPGALLSRPALAKARRRLGALPSVTGARIDYRPLPDGTVEVDAAVAERALVPGPARLALESARALVVSEGAVDLGPLLGSADRWTLAGRWSGPARHARASVAGVVPPAPGVVEVGLSWTSERHAVPDRGRGEARVETEERLAGWLGVSEWVHARLRLAGLLGWERWEEWGRAARVGGAATWTLPSDVGRVGAGADAWMGARGPFVRSWALVSVEAPLERLGALRAEAGWTGVSADAPRVTWPGAGTGSLRAPLLRAHPLAVGDAIGGPALGPRLAHVTVEPRGFVPWGPLRVGASVFVDAAAVAGSSGEPGPAGWVDVGASLLVGHGADEISVSVARGAAGWVTSVRMTPSDLRPTGSTAAR